VIMQHPAHWRKSSRSNNNGGSCVEVAAIGEAIAIRDSKLDTTVPYPKIIISKMEWQGLMKGMPNPG